MKETKFKQTLVQTKDERRKTKESTRHCEEHSDVAIQGDFKMTEVGLIPNDWGVKKIGELCSITTGSQNTQDHKEDGKYPFFVRSQEVERIDKYIFDTEGVVTAGDGVGTGKIFHYVNGKFGLHQRCYLMYEFDRNISAKYFYWIFSVNFYDRVHSMTAKSSVDSVRREMIADMPIALPPIKEQQRIANALSDIDTLIANLEKLIAKKKNIKQGAMQQLLTGKKRLPGFGSDERQKECHSKRNAKREVEESNGYKMTELGIIPSDWEVKKLSSVCTIIMGQSPDSKYYNEKEGTPLIQGNADIENRETFVRFYTTQITKKGLKGDLILTVRAPVGSVAKATFDCCLGRGVCALRNANDFLYQYLIYIEKEWAKRSAGSTFDSIKSDELSATLVVVPSSKAEQTAIANVLSDMDTEIATLETKLAKYRTLKTGMMQQLLTGKIRLVDAKSETKSVEKNRVVPVAFKRAVLAAEIAHRLCAEPTFGHVKMEKMLFLAEKMCELDINSSYHRDAAGPYDNRALRSVDSQLEKQKWFKFIRSDKGNHYIPLEKRGGHSQYFERYYAECRSVFDNIINTFKIAKTEQCEIVATLYSAWEDFLNQGVNPTDDQIVTEVLTNWNESKKRIPRDRWIKALLWMKENKFIPLKQAL